MSNTVVIRIFRSLTKRDEIMVSVKTPKDKSSQSAVVANLAEAEKLALYWIGKLMDEGEVSFSLEKNI
jgi:hypothetical protein